MCGRYTARKAPADLAAEFEAQDRLAEATRSDFNVAPTRVVPVVRAEKDRPAVRELVDMRWGLVPFWAKDAKIGARLINARVESVTAKPAFRSALKKRRCIVPADGWYEWKRNTDGPGKQPYYLTPADGSSLGFAGLWEIWGEGESRLVTCTILTTGAEGRPAEIHDRMPFLLPRDAWAKWLDPTCEDAEELLSAPDLALAGRLELRPVGAAVGKVGNNYPELIARAEPDAVLF